MKNQNNIPGHINIGVSLISAQAANLIAELESKGITIWHNSNGLNISYTNKTTKADLRKARQIVKRATFADFFDWRGTNWHTPFQSYMIPNLVWCRKNIR